MSLTQLSPGVNVREIDLTNFIPNVGVSGGAFVGQFSWGPVLDYTVISDSNRLARVFGKPTDANFVDWYSVSNFLAYTNNCTVVRVVHDNAGVATAGNAACYKDTTATYPPNFLAPLIKNDAEFQSYYVGTDANAYAFAARYAGALGNSLRVIVVDGNSWSQLSVDYQRLFDFAPGTSEYAASLGASNDEVHVIVIDENGLFTGVPGTVLEKFAFLSKARDGKSNDNAPSFFGNVINQKSEYVRYLNSDFDNSVLPASRWVSAVALSTDSTRSVASVSLNAAAIGGSGYAVDEVITLTAPGSGVTATAKVTAVDGSGQITAIALVNGGSGYAPGATVVGVSIASVGGTAADLTAITATLTTGTIGGSGYAVNDVITLTAPSISGQPATVRVTSVDGSGQITGIAIQNPGAGYAAGQAVVGASIVTTSGVGADLTNVIATLSTVDYAIWDSNIISPSGVISQYSQLTEPFDAKFYGGSNGGDLDSGDLIAGWNMFANSEEVDVSILFVGDAGDLGNSDTTARTVINHVITNIAEGRKDCVVFFSPRKDDVVDQTQETATENVITFRNALNTSSSYASMDSGWKLMYDVYNDKYRWVPLNADIAGLCAATDLSYDPWWSPAGFTRGKVKGVVSLAFNPNKTQRDQLYSSNVNPVVSFKGDGVVLYGDKTLQAKASAFQFINVRRLFLVLEKAISRAAKYQLFEFNDQFTRAQFRNMVEPYLREVQGRRGIYDFKVVCDETNNTAEVIDRAEFVASIFIKPARSINYITLNFVAVRTGVAFEEVVGAV